MQYEIQAAWPEPCERDRQEVVDFWIRELALPDRKTAENRSHQLLVVARDASDCVCGVSTAVRTYVDQLGFECFYYRTFVGRTHRARGLRSTRLVWRILQESYGVLNQRFSEGHDLDVLGLYAEIENESLMRRRRALVWNDEGMNAIYIGRTANGQHVRVCYFTNAELKKER